MFDNVFFPILEKDRSFEERNCHTENKNKFSIVWFPSNILPFSGKKKWQQRTKHLLFLILKCFSRAWWWEIYHLKSKTVNIFHLKAIITLKLMLQMGRSSITMSYVLRCKVLKYITPKSDLCLNIFPPDMRTINI